MKTLLILGGNPVYNAPVDLGFGRVAAKIEIDDSLGSLPERNVADVCTWHLPQAHFLESWGDARADDGAYSVVQPMIEPLYGGKSAIEVLAMICWTADRRDGTELVRDQFQADCGRRSRMSKVNWRETLHDGIFAR